MQVNIDATAPEGDIQIGQNSIKGIINQLTFGLFFKDDVQVTITASDTQSGVNSVEYTVSDQILTLEQVQALTSWRAYTGPIDTTAQNTKKVVYYVRVTDNMGNVTYFASNGMVFDTVAPVVDGVVNGQTYYTTQQVIITDDNLADDTKPSMTIAGDTTVTHQIVANDKAGNTTTITVYVKPIATLAEDIAGLTTGNVIPANRNAILAVQGDRYHPRHRRGKTAAATNCRHLQQSAATAYPAATGHRFRHRAAGAAYHHRQCGPGGLPGPAKRQKSPATGD